MPLLILIALLMAMPAAADPETDYRSIHHDWQKDGQITRCYWTLEQLENARRISDENPDDSYNDFPDQVDAEIARRRRGECDPPPDLRIGSVKPRRERVVLLNRSGKPVSLDGYRLTDRQGHKLRLDGRRIVDRLVVKTRRQPMWDDRGDVARLLYPGGKVISQLGYGRFKHTERF